MKQGRLNDAFTRNRRVEQIQMPLTQRGYGFDVVSAVRRAAAFPMVVKATAPLGRIVK